MLKNIEIYSLKSSFERFKHLDISHLINFHLVFDKLPLNKAYYDVFEAIDNEILSKINMLEANFDLENNLKTALCKLTRNDRKKYGLNKFWPKSINENLRPSIGIWYFKH